MRRFLRDGWGRFWVAVWIIAAVTFAYIHLTDPTTAQDRDAERIAVLETQVAWLVPNTMDLNGAALPPPVLAADIGWFTAGQSFTTENAFRLVCRIGELNTYYDLTCVRATFP